ncbi:MULTISPECIES: FISUMP domain-containing protein [unclassified Fibrobacter]|uniref:FISUMP domain-containing protein n=1 Tax=unclassified Fibrobacter TaxID=2634177 RepID=UPI000D7A03CD|nr:MULTISPECIES: FISUMP domain-containing protein [unclassified Fibrobacter]PWJ61136.1 uncharacterized protein (TIGR02145 family) [Fibrobacter sp. UWR4]PZW65594.1 uncharacterized protein (TIGR02145 family) [Fibrobacter sp. UWR1]
MRHLSFIAIFALLSASLFIGCTDIGLRDNPNDPGAENFQDGDVVSEGGGYGYVYDSRDKQSYRVVTIEKKYWFAQNLNYAASNSFCYDGVSSNCKSRGRLYRWASKDLCPEGWAVPTKKDWNELFDYGNGYARWFLSNEGRVWGDDAWNLKNNYGFSIKPAGYRSADGTYRGFDNLTGFWTRTTESDEKAYSVWVTYEDPYPDITPYGKDNALSIRCIKEI